MTSNSIKQPIQLKCITTDEYDRIDLVLLEGLA